MVLVFGVGYGYLVVGLCAKVFCFYEEGRALFDSVVDRFRWSVFLISI